MGQQCKAVGEVARAREMASLDLYWARESLRDSVPINHVQSSLGESLYGLW